MQREKITLGWTSKGTPVADITFVEVEAPVSLPAAAPTFVVQQVTPWSKPDPLDMCLALWTDWMAGDSDRDLGVKTIRSLSGEGGGRGVDLHEAQQASDIKIAQATDAMISSLSRMHVWAIYRACGLTSLWNFPHASLMETVISARAELEMKLKRNICTSLLF